MMLQVARDSHGSSSPSSSMRGRPHGLQGRTTLCATAPEGDDRSMTRLIFIGGGPWHDKQLDSSVENAPERIDVTSDPSGVYERLGVADGDAIVYMWRSDA